MSDLFDTSAVRDETAHWDALAQRVTAQALRRSTEGAGLFIASRAGWIAASILLAVALGLIALPVGRASRTVPSDEWSRALSPVDSVGAVIAARSSPPSLAALLLGGEAP